MSDKDNFEYSDQYLIKKVKIGDNISFKSLFEKYWSELYIYAFNILKSRDSCEDIVQEVFTVLWQNAKKQDILNPQAYLYKSVKFQVLNHIRNNKIHQKHLDRLQIVSSTNNLEEEINFKELDNLLFSATQKLPVRCHEIFELSRVHYLSNKEIATKLNISVQTVKNQISSALSFLRKDLEDSYLLILLFLN